MKYLRKIVALLIGVVFFAALIISLGRIFAIKNVNVTLITYADDCSESYGEAKRSLEEFKGESLLFLSEKEIVEAFSAKNSNYAVTECEKKYPCTVNVTLKERHEVFAVFVGGLYSMYDSDGKYLRSSIENTNVNDGSPNVEFTGVAVEKVPDLAVVAATFKSAFKSLRSVVASIGIDSRPDVEGYVDRLYFNLRCGLKIRIDDYEDRTEEKIRLAYEKFCTLTDRQKLRGTLRSYRIGDENGIINADYSAS